METLIDEKKLEQGIFLLECLISERRLLLMQLLVAHGEMSVNSISQLLKIPQPAVSYHLQQLFDAGYLWRNRSGKFTYYSVKKPRVKLVAEVVERLG